jgi:hypothetical protein
MRPLNILLLLAFILSVSVQFNDPDPLPWTIFYGAAAGCCLAHHLGRLYWHLAALIAVIALVLCLWLLPQFLGQVSATEIFESLTMKTQAVEEAREAGGALVVAIWMSVLAVMCQRSSRREQQT